MICKLTTYAFLCEKLSSIEFYDFEYSNLNYRLITSFDEPSRRRSPTDQSNHSIIMSQFLQLQSNTFLRAFFNLNRYIS